MNERLEKIRALLAKAEATDHVEEAKVFTAKAQELMSKWSIDEAMLMSYKGEDPTIDVLHVYIDANEYRSPKVDLLHIIAENNDCKIVLGHQHYREVDGKRKRQFRVTVIGTESDRNSVELLYTSLMLQVEHALLDSQVIIRMQIDCLEGGHRIRWRNSFVRAFAFAVGDKLHDAKKRAVEQVQTESKVGTETMALVLIGKKQLVERRMGEIFPNLKKGKASSAGRSIGASDILGHEAGRRADLGSPKVKAANRKALKK